MDLLNILFPDSTETGTSGNKVRSNFGDSEVAVSGTETGNAGGSIWGVLDGVYDQAVEGIGDVLSGRISETLNGLTSHGPENTVDTRGEVSDQVGIEGDTNTNRDSTGFAGIGIKTLAIGAGALVALYLVLKK